MPDSGSTVIEEAPGAAAAAAGPRLRRTPSRRWQLLGLLGLLVLAGLIAAGLYWLLVASHEVSTDNAYVGADTAAVTPLVSGSVLKVLVAETQQVQAGEPVVLLDPADAKIAVAQAQAALGQAERQVRGLFANDMSLAAQVAARQASVAQAEAEIAGAQGDLQRAETDLRRRQTLSASGAVSGDELTNAENRMTSAKSALLAAQAAKAAAVANRGAAQGSREVNTAMISGVDVEHNPDVLAARARLDAAELALSRTVVPAPMSGIVSKKAVEIGQQLQPGAVVMQVVPTDTMYVDANFKEVQLARVRPGQAVDSHQRPLRLGG